MSLPTTLLRLAVEIAIRHNATQAGRITVIPVIVDDLPQALPVLKALCDLTEGRLFNAVDSELAGPVPATSDTGRRQSVERALSAEQSNPRYVELSEKGEGMIDAVLASPPTEAPSPGERTVLAIARAAMHRDLDSYQFAVIAYSEADMDYFFRRRIWSLAVDHLNNLPNKTLRTLVVAIEAEIDIDLHCGTDRGFQLAVVGDRILHRKHRDALQAEAARIARNARHLVLFLGAGFSASSQMPLANSMRVPAIRRILNIPETELVTFNELAKRFHVWLTEQDWMSAHEKQLPVDQFIGELTLEQVVRAEKKMYPGLPTLVEFRKNHDNVIGAPGSAVLDLAEILKHTIGRIVIVEVNIDLLIETHMKMPLRVFVTEEEFKEAPEYLRRYFRGEESDIPVLKIHGSISDLDSCVVSVEQTQLGIGPPKLDALQELKDDESPPCWVYLGCSLRDLDIRPILEREDFARGVDERWVGPYLDESVEQFGILREPRWKNGDFPTIYDRIITETADAFMSALRFAFENKP